jgi:hypothetical protein
LSAAQLRKPELSGVGPGSGLDPAGALGSDARQRWDTTARRIKVILKKDGREGTFASVTTVKLLDFRDSSDESA